MKHDRRGSWYLLTGAVLGIAMGLLYSWMISPVEYVDAPPYALRADFKDEYRSLVAAAYLYSHDLLRAKDRLAQLNEEELSKNLAMQAQRALEAGRPEGEVRALSILAMALEEGLTLEAPGMLSSQSVTTTPTMTSDTPTPMLVQSTDSQIETQAGGTTQTGTAQIPQATDTPQPSSTVTPTPTQGAPFVLQETRLLCNPDQPDPLIQVEIKDAANQPVPSVELVVTWDEGEDHFFTGLKPELGLGYADFLMTPDVVYTLQLATGGQPVNDLIAAECLLEDGGRYWGSWMLTFVQP